VAELPTVLLTPVVVLTGVMLGLGDGVLFPSSCASEGSAMGLLTTH
jgi:hypothetical protein